MLILHGEQGSAKTTIAEWVRLLTDPQKALTRAAPKNEEDLAIAAKGCQWLIFDNLSSIRPWLADAFCRLATGCGLGTRKFYTNDEEVVFYAMRPILLNGIPEFADRPDLLDRAILFHLPVFQKAERKRRKFLFAEFEEARPRLLGALLDAVSGVLRLESEIDDSDLPRMADFACRGIALERYLNWKEGSFLEAYKRKRARSEVIALESSVIWEPLQKMIACKKFRGNSASLLADLRNRLPSGRYPSGWPNSPQALSREITRIAPGCRNQAIKVDRIEHGRTWVIEKMETGMKRDERDKRDASPGDGE